MNSPSLIAAVVLTYNSSRDLRQCLEGLLVQRGVDLRVFVVDNASDELEREQMQRDFLAVFPEGVLLEAGVDETVEMRSAFVRNDSNNGYSAGNNIGARLAVSAGCLGVSLINPDVRISNPHYIAQLTECLLSDPQVALVGSAITNLNGANENPMEEPTFLDELLWPLKMVSSAMGMPRSGRSVMRSGTARPVHKLSGSCFLIRAKVLKQIDYFDEGVFLYCEESILAAQMQSLGYTMAYAEKLEAKHLHDTSEKGDPTKRYRIWSRSRRYYHRAFTNYGPLRRILLAASQEIIILLVQVKKIGSR